MLEVVALTLSLEGHTVLAASSARDALARLDAGESVDLVLTDLHMPEMSGWEVMRVVRSRWPSVRVGIHSGSLDQFPEEHQAPDLLLSKPVHPDDLREALKWLR